MNSALLIIDVQSGLFDTSPPPFEADAVVDRINAVAARARAALVPVFLVQHESAQGVLAYQSESWQPQRGLHLTASDIMVRKTTPDAFLRTELSELLTKYAIEHLLICGYATEFCVDTTTRRAAALGFPVTLISDAHTTHDKPHATAAQIRTHHNATLANIRSFGPRITAVPSADIAFTGP